MAMETVTLHYGEFPYAKMTEKSRKGRFWEWTPIWKFQRVDFTLNFPL